MLVFSCISPHPPIILPSVGSLADRARVKKTIKALEKLGEKLKKINPEKIIISSPHSDWGFDVPLFFLAKDFKGKIEKVLIGSESPRFYFEKGINFSVSDNFQKKVFDSDNKQVKSPDSRIALIASGDLSHCLKAEGPYGFHLQGPEFDKTLINALKEKDIETILKLDRLCPQALECGLRSFSFLLGMLEASKKDYLPEIISYEYPFGVGYLVVDFEIKESKIK